MQNIENGVVWGLHVPVGHRQHNHSIERVDFLFYIRIYIFNIRKQGLWSYDHKALYKYVYYYYYCLFRVPSLSCRIICV